ncbi:FkbM family methyltransferase [Burkholderiaceae bacterium]|nr:FkbM family methyltransferase [Burkholderiaceae bacterium]
MKTVKDSMITETRPITAEAAQKHGFVPGYTEKIYRLLSKCLIKLIRLNGRTRFSNIFIQMLNPVCEIKWDKSKLLKYRTGHGRLFWRVSTFFAEEPMMIDWLRTFRSDDVFLDIGANVGIYTVPGAYKAKLTYACELDPVNIGILKENIHLNELHAKVIILPFAAGGESRVSKIYYRDFSRGDALQSMDRETVLNTIEGPGKHTSMQLAFPLDKIFKDFALTLPTRVKIDVDGNEKAVFKGASETIFSAQEIYFEDSGLKDCGEIIEQILANGFEISNRETPIRSFGGCNILFIKKRLP